MTTMMIVIGLFAYFSKCFSVRFIILLNSKNVTCVICLGPIPYLCEFISIDVARVLSQFSYINNSVDNLKIEIFENDAF